MHSYYVLRHLTDGPYVLSSSYNLFQMFGLPIPLHGIIYLLLLHIYAHRYIPYTTVFAIICLLICWLFLALTILDTNNKYVWIVRVFTKLFSHEQDVYWQIHPTKPKHYCIVWNEPPQALPSMSMHTKRNIYAIIKQATSPH